MAGLANVPQWLRVRKVQPISISSGPARVVSNREEPMMAPVAGSWARSAPPLAMASSKKRLKTGRCQRS